MKKLPLKKRIIDKLIYLTLNDKKFQEFLLFLFI